MNKAPAIMRHSRLLITETYTNPEQFASPSEFLAALTEGLNELCNAFKVEPPDFSQVEWRRG